MSEHMAKAREELLDRLREQEAVAANTKRAVNALCVAMGEPIMFEDSDIDKKAQPQGQIHPDQFFGKPLATAVRTYLEMRGRAVPFQEIMDALTRGGFDFGNDKFAEKNLRISLSKNTTTFVQIKGSDSFGLVDWYDLKKNGGKKRGKGQDSQDQIPDESSEIAEETESDVESGAPEENKEG